MHELLWVSLTRIESETRERGGGGRTIASSRSLHWSRAGPPSRASTASIARTKKNELTLASPCSGSCFKFREKNTYAGAIVIVAKMCSA